MPVFLVTFFLICLICFQVSQHRYKDRGIYSIVNNETDLQQKFSNHLGLYFLSLIADGNTPFLVRKHISKLEVRDASTLSSDNFILNKFSLSDSAFIHKKNEEIVTLIAKVQGRKLPPRALKNVEPKSTLTGMESTIKIMASQFNQFSNYADLEISDSYKEIIIDFANRNNIVLDKDFWNLGNLKKRIAAVVLTSSGVTFEGTEEEKEQFKLIMNIYHKIIEYNEYTTYFSTLDNKKYIECVMSNVGTTFDEDIDIKIIIEAGNICDTNNLPIPDSNIIKEINDVGVLNYLYKISENENIVNFSNYPVLAPDISDIMPSDILNRKSLEEEYELNRRKYRNKVNNIFCYKKFNGENNCFRQ